jgi:protein-L-isoaspartate(D-aspartate) O-methyltransferase
MQESYKYRGQRAKLVEKIRRKGITDEAVLEAIGRIPRHRFVEGAFRDQAYEDKALPIRSGQTISQPFTVAYQTQMMGLTPGMKILEIGTGSGYQAAVLCEMGMKVFSVERSQELHQEAKERLFSLGYEPYLKCGDGTRGWKLYQPFQRILVTAASPDIPEPLKQQLDIGGKLIIPVGGRNTQKMTVVTRTKTDRYSVQTFHEFRFVPLIGEYGWEE